MYKIYSRPRIKIPKFINFFKLFNHNYGNKPTKIRKLISYIFLFIIVFLIVRFILESVLPIFDNLCGNKAESIATLVANEQATNVMKKYSYNELFSIEKDSAGNIKMVNANIIKINEIISDVAMNIENGINSRGKEDIKIALGSFSGSKLLAGRGPQVKIVISSKGNVETDLKSEFITQGINQTLHRVYLQVNCKVKILTPFDSIEREIVNQIMLAENVIIGDIPENYYNFNGLDDKKDALEIMQ